MTFLSNSFGAISPASEGGGGGGGEPVSYTAATQKGTWDRRTDNTTIPAGGLYVEVVNMDIMETITINGKTLKGGERWHSQAIVNEVDRTHEFIEEINILSTGAEYLFRVSYPQSSSVIVNNI